MLQAMRATQQTQPAPPKQAQDPGGTNGLQDDWVGRQLTRTTIAWKTIDPEDGSLGRQLTRRLQAAHESWKRIQLKGRRGLATLKFWERKFRTL